MWTTWAKWCNSWVSRNRSTVDGRQFYRNLGSARHLNIHQIVYISPQVETATNQARGQNKTPETRLETLGVNNNDQPTRRALNNTP